MESVSSNEPILAKCDVAVRIKPLGAGAGDVTVECEEKYSGWRYKGCNVAKNEITFGDIDPKKKQITYNFPKFIADGDFS